jgi:GDPmannose 4,6-dehydratase
MGTAIIFGVSGQDGAFLSRLLLEKEYRVVGVSRDCRKASFHNLERLTVRDRVELISNSMDDLKTLTQILSHYQPDEIYNLAGQSSVGLSFEKPFETVESIAGATLTLLEAIRLVGLPVRLFNAGSSECFGDTEGIPATEELPFRPVNPYGVAKAAAFWQVANYREVYDIFACTGILFNHESFLRPETFVTRKIVKTACRIAKGSCEKIRLGNISIERDWGWAPEYVTAMWMMLQQEQPEDYILATGATFSLQSFVAKVFERLGLDWKEHVETDERFMRPSDIQIVRANPGKAEQKLNWKVRFKTDDVAKMMVDAELELNPFDRL